MKFLALTLPMPPNLANARMHWRTKHKLLDQWRNRAIVLEKKLRGRGQYPKAMQRVRVSATFYVGSSRYLMDDDNATARLKWCLDLLKQCGVIVDDKRPHLTLTGIPDQQPAGPRRVELVVEDVS